MAHLCWVLLHGICLPYLPKLKNELASYTITSIKDDRVVFTSGSDEKVFILSDYITENNQLCMPNYDDSILAIDASIRKYYGLATNYKTNAILDEILKAKAE